MQCRQRSPHGIPAVTLAPLQRFIHAAAQLVNGLRPRDRITSALNELYWLLIVQRFDYKLCLLVHKSVISNPLAYFTNLLTAVADVPCRSALRDALNGNFVVPRTRFKLGERAFFVAAPLAWNRLPTNELKTLRSTADFKRDLKTFLFRIAYNE